MASRLGWLVAVGLTLALGAEAWAHGGYYTGPKTSDGVPLPTSGPGSGPSTGSKGRDGPSTYGPAVTGRKGPEEVTPTTESLPPGLAEPGIRGTQWEHWWSIYKSEFLGRGAERNRRLATRRAERDKFVAARREKLASILSGYLKDASPEVRASAALAVGRLGHQGARPRLHGMATGDELREVQDAAILGIAMIALPEDLPTLDMILSDRTQNVTVRSLAAVAIGWIGGPDAAASLRTAMDADAIKRGDVPPALAASLYYGLGFASDSMATKAVTDGLDKKLGSAVVRSYAGISVGRLHLRDRLQKLGEALHEHPDASTRRSAALALGLMAGPKDAVALQLLRVGAEQGNDPGTRRFCALALGGIRSEAVRAAMEDAFRKAKPVDRPFRALCLGLQGDLKSAPALREALVRDEFEESLQGAYSIALGLLGDKEAVPLLEAEVGRLGRTWSPGYAALALAMIGSQSSAPKIHERLTKTSDAATRGNLRVALGLLGDEKVLGVMREAVAKGETIYDRATAAMGLGLARDHESIEALSRVAVGNAAEPGVLRGAAIAALGRIAQSDEAAVLSALLEGNNFSVELPALVYVAEALNDR